MLKFDLPEIELNRVSCLHQMSNFQLHIDGNKLCLDEIIRPTPLVRFL